MFLWTSGQDQTKCVKSRGGECGNIVVRGFLHICVARKKVRKRESCYSSSRKTEHQWSEITTKVPMYEPEDPYVGTLTTNLQTWESRWHSITHIITFKFKHFHKCLSQHPRQAMSLPAGHILTMSTCNCLVVIWEITSEFSLTPSSRIYPYVITLPTGVICIASSTTAIISLKRSKHNFLWCTDIMWINRKGAKYGKSTYSK